MNYTLIIDEDVAFYWANPAELANNASDLFEDLLSKAFLPLSTFNNR